jgi:hypothetical protein
MEANGTVTRVSRIPLCDIDSSHGDAYADASIPTMRGTWGYVCRPCFDANGCTLGEGRGQELRLPEPEPVRVISMGPTVGDMLEGKIATRPDRRISTMCSGGQEAHEEHMRLNGECPWEH